MAIDKTVIKNQYGDRNSRTDVGTAPFPRYPAPMEHGAHRSDPQIEALPLLHSSPISVMQKIAKNRVVYTFGYGCMQARDIDSSQTQREWLIPDCLRSSARRKNEDSGPLAQSRIAATFSGDAQPSLACCRERVVESSALISAHVLKRTGYPTVARANDYESPSLFSAPDSCLSAY